MDGFVTSHIAADVNGPEDGPYTMGYLERNDIPFHYALAGHPDYTPAAGADFVLLGDVVWNDSRGPAAALMDAEQTIRQACAAVPGKAKAEQG